MRRVKAPAACARRRSRPAGARAVPCPSAHRACGTAPAPARAHRTSAAPTPEAEQHREQNRRLDSGPRYAVLSSTDAWMVLAIEEVKALWHTGMSSFDDQK